MEPIRHSALTGKMQKDPLRDRGSTDVPHADKEHAGSRIHVRMVGIPAILQPAYTQPMPGQAWTNGLSDQQRRAAAHDAGPLIVLAGPGTGKTRVIIARIRRLIEEGAAPESVLALTFTIKAAEEMRSRLAEAVGPIIADRVRASTFHAFGNGIITRFGDWIGVRSDRTFMDSAQSNRLLRRLIFDHNLYEHLAAAGREKGIMIARRFIAACKNAARTAEQARDHAAKWSARIDRNEQGLDADALESERVRCLEFTDSARLFAVYEAECLQRGLLTFDDCIALPLRLFRERPSAAAIIRDETRHLLVDEFQDVNPAQLELLRHLAPPRGVGDRPADLVVVGDDDQAIYGFRGAESRAFARFATAWPERQETTLTINRRSAPAVISTSNAVIARCMTRFAPSKRIEPPEDYSGPPGSVEGVILSDDKQAGVVIASMILLDRKANPERAFDSYGVLARNNSDVDLIASELDRLGIPVSLRRRPSPLEDQAVQDLLAWVRLLVEPGGTGEAAAAQRLLARPPYFVRSRRAAEWRLAYERARGFGEHGGQQSFTEWLPRCAAGEPAVERMLALLDHLRAFTATNRADRVIHEIIRAADLARSEPLEGHERASRVSALVDLMTFTRSRQPHLDEPGDLAAWWRYYNDLDQKERDFSSMTDARLDSAADEDITPDGGCVTVLSAHRAKGLEFDTVFLAKCRPTGFPGKARSAQEQSEESPLPAEFSGHDRDEQADEERRLFYVACTRAKRRLVLLAKQKGKGSRTTDYFNELTVNAPTLNIGTRAESEILDEAGALPGGDLPAALSDVAVAAHRRENLIRSMSAEVRTSAYAALHDAASADLPADRLRSIAARLADAAAALHALEHLRSRGTLPADTPPDYRERLDSLVERLNSSSPPPALTEPMTAPLKLSYSVINEYLNCPACFYIRRIRKVPEEFSDKLHFGSTIHTILERFFKEWRDADADGRKHPGPDRLAVICETTVREGWPASRPFDRASLDMALAQTRGALISLHDPASNILEIERFARFKYPDPDTPGLFHDFSLKVDRIDQMPDGGIRLIDYKTGSTRKELREPQPDDLQLCIYAMALPALFQERDRDASHGSDRPERLPIESLPDPCDTPPSGVAEYWVLPATTVGRIALRDLDLAAARLRIDEAIRGMLAGRYPRGRECKELCLNLGFAD